jgi:hypothetical protein
MFAGAPASAEILASITRPDDFVSDSAVDVLVPVRPNGGTFLKFTTTGSGVTQVMITYNAVCVVSQAGGYLLLRILVDGAPANPDDDADNIFCTSLPAGLQWMNVSRQAMLKVPAGEHTVQVYARVAAGAGTWRLDNSSLVVQK